MPSPSRRVMVIHADAQVFVGNDVNGKVPPGSVLRYTEQRESWLFVPSRRAWISTDDVIPLEKSEAHFTNIIEQAPTATAFHHRGIARHELGYHELALEDLDEAIKRGLNSPAVFVNRAIVWHSLQNDRNALADINQALAADPTSALAYNNRALIWASLGNLGQALEDATEAIRLDPAYAEAFNNRGVTLVRQGKVEAALADYGRAIELNDRYAEAYANRGYAAKKLHRYAAALGDYRRAVELAPDSPQAFNDAAWLIATCPDRAYRNPARAIDYAVYACELTKYQNGEYVDTLAAAYASAGRFDDAVRSQQQALTLLPEAARQPSQERLALYRQQRPFVESE